MTVYLVPAYIKPYAKILSWALPMCYVEKEKSEYITDLKIATPVIREEIRAFKDYQLVTMRTDIRGNPEAFKVYPNTETTFFIPVEEFIEKVSEGKNFGTVKGEFNLLKETAYQLVEKIYPVLDEDLRPVISPPLQWLIYSRKEKAISRLCWVIELKGEIIVRPYGSSNIMLEVDQLKYDKINSASLQIIKRNAILKMRLHDYWRTKISSEVMASKVQELQAFVEEEKEEETTELEGEVE